MKQGDAFRCPLCHEDSFLKKESVLEGWKKVGEVWKCALCSGKIADVEQEKTEEKGSENTEAFLRLQAFLGEEPEEKPKVSLSNSDRKFCKDCTHAVRHPFHLMCSLREKEVDPMSDCPDYKPRGEEPFPRP